MEITNPDKILYPEQALTKLDLALYYQGIAELILPYIINRPLTIVRCPQGWQKTCFYQKHLGDIHNKDLYAINIKEKHGIQPYIYIKNIKGLMALVQLGVLEIHPWGCRINNIEKPDIIIFDLDPAPDIEWKQVIHTAFLIKENLEKINLTSFVKTTGGKGLHIVVPIIPQYNWEEVTLFTHTFVDYIVSLRPNDYIATMSKKKRKGKIFLDYLRNHRGATAIAAYSTRARENAPIAMPISWNDLTPKLKPANYTVKNILNYLDKRKTDPWSDFFKIKQKL